MFGLSSFVYMRIPAAESARVIVITEMKSRTYSHAHSNRGSPLKPALRAPTPQPIPRPARGLLCHSAYWGQSHIPCVRRHRDARISYERQTPNRDTCTVTRNTPRAYSIPAARIIIHMFTRIHTLYRHHFSSVNTWIIE